MALHVLFSVPEAPGIKFECFDYNAISFHRNVIEGNAESQTEFMYGSRENFVSCRWINLGGSGTEATLTLQRLAVKFSKGWAQYTSGARML